MDVMMEHADLYARFRTFDPDMDLDANSGSQPLDNIEITCLTKLIDQFYHGTDLIVDMRIAINLCSITMTLYEARRDSKVAEVHPWARLLNRLAFMIRNSLTHGQQVPAGKHYFIMDLLKRIDEHDASPERVVQLGRGDAAFVAWRQAWKPVDSPFSDYLVATLMQLFPEDTWSWRVRRLQEMPAESRAIAQRKGEEEGRGEPTGLDLDFSIVQEVDSGFRYRTPVPAYRETPESLESLYTAGPPGSYIRTHRKGYASTIGSPSRDRRSPDLNSMSAEVAIWKEDEQDELGVFLEHSLGVREGFLSASSSTAHAPLLGSEDNPDATIDTAGYEALSTKGERQEDPEAILEDSLRLRVGLTPSTVAGEVLDDTLLSPSVQDNRDDGLRVMNEDVDMQRAESVSGDRGLVGYVDSPNPWATVETSEPFAPDTETRVAYGQADWENRIGEDDANLTDLWNVH